MGELGVVHIEVDVLEGVFEPVVGVDAEVVAANNEGVEDSIVLCAAVVLAEEVVFAAQYRGALSLFYGVGCGSCRLRCSVLCAATVAGRI